MRILHVVDSLALHMGGTARAPLDICAGLLERGHEVLLVSTVGPTDEMCYLAQEYHDVPTKLFPRSFPSHNFRSPALHRWLATAVARYDLVEIHGVFSFVPIYAAWTCSRARTPYTVRPHGSLDPFDLRKHALGKRVLGPLFFRPLLQGAAGIFLTSAMEADRMVTFGADPVKVVTPLPVSPPAHLGDGPRFRAIHGIPPDALVVLLLGRIHPKKGLQFLLPSLASLKQQHPKLWCLLIGSGEVRHVEEVNALLDQYEMRSWTTQCGFLAGDLKQSAFAASDVFALPSLNENFGIVVVEAMYAGLPLLISTEVYIKDVVIAGGAGIVCKPSIASCRFNLHRLLSDRGARQRMSAAGPGVATHHFAPDRCVQLLEEAQRSLLHRAALTPGQR